MTATAPRSQARSAGLTAWLALLVALAGCAPDAPAGTTGGTVSAGSSAAGPAPSQAGRSGPPETSSDASGYQDPAPRASDAGVADGVVPTAVRIPRLGVESELEHLVVGADGRITPPDDWQRAGWYEQGVVPGDVGPAVIAGHVDSPTGPAVFWDLADLAAGDEVGVTLSDGTSTTFAVDRALHAAKAEFPTSDVYRSTPTPQLRLITCSGDWDPATGHYEDNLVVFASATT